MTVVTISRQLGSQGEEIAAAVAQKLGLRLIDAQTINQAAQKAGVPDRALAELENEGAHGLADQVLKALHTMPSLRSAPSFSAATAEAEGASYAEQSSLTLPFVGLFSPTVPPISASLESYVRMVGLVIRGLAREGNVLVVGRGGQVLLRKYPCALHVQIVAPVKRRIETVMAREDLQWRSAQSRVRASDRARFDYLRRYHDAYWLDATLYHLVLNTGRLPLETVADLVVSAQESIIGPAGSGDSAS
jgi:cytidylate kinase